MKDKTILILGIALAVVVVTSALVYRVRLPAVTGNDPLGLAACAADNLSSLSVRTGVGTETATRSNDIWEVAGQPASSTRIQELIESLQVAQSELVARNGRETPAYGLTGSPTFSCEVGGVTHAYDVGSVDRSRNAVYVARAGEGATYLVTGTTLGSFVRESFATWSGVPTATSTLDR